MNIARRRLVNQRLIDHPFESAAAVVRWFGAVQAQDHPNAKYAVALRMRSATDAALNRAFDTGEIIRTHALRPTWHFLAAEDVRWILALTGPRVQAANTRVYRQYGLDDVVLRKAGALIAKALEGGRFLTRPELMKMLHSTRIDTSGIRGSFIAGYAELEGIICSGPMRGKAHTYALLDERVPRGHAYVGDEALAELALRYFTSHGPATVHDFSWWSGQTIGESRRAVAILDKELQHAEVASGTYWFREDVDMKVRAPVVHLLPNYDEHVVAYRDHGPSIDPRSPDVLKGWGNALTTHMVSVNGLVLGGWKRRVERDRVVIQLILPVALSAGERRALERALQHYSNFMELPVEYAEKTTRS